MRLLSVGNFIGRLSDSRRHIAITALVFIIFFGFVDYLVDYAMIVAGVDDKLHSALQATIVGVIAGITVYLLLRARGERRRVINDEIDRVVELNHSLRNSLEIIAHSHYVTSEEVRKTMLLETAQKMSDKLTELFPTMVHERRRRHRARDIMNRRENSISGPEESDKGQRLA